jgi:hypothetical protein
MSMGSMWASTTHGEGNSSVRISPDIDQVVTELAARFPAVPPETLRTVVTEEFGVFDGAAITTFVPVLVAKAATTRLTRNGAPIARNTHTGQPDVADAPPPAAVGACPHLVGLNTEPGRTGPL